MGPAIVAAAGAAIVLRGFIYASDVATGRIEARYPRAGDVVEVDGESVHYIEKGEGQPVILLHGASGNAREFVQGGLMDRLAERYRVISFDRPGSGYTTRRGRDLHDPRRQAAVLAAAAAKLGAARPIVVGHSLGGAVAVAWALGHEVTGVATLGGVAMKRPDKPVLLYAAVDTPVVGRLISLAAPLVFRADYIANSVEEIFAPQSAPPGYVETIGAALATRPAMARATAADRVRLSPILAEMSAHYGRIEAPFEIITGDRDGSVPPEVHSIPLSEALPNARLTVLEGVGHMPHHARPEVLEEALARLAGS